MKNAARLLSTLLPVLFLLFVDCRQLFARERISGWCEQGNQSVSVPGSSPSVAKFQRSYPSCTVTVYKAGTTDLAVIFSDNSGTPLANPFASAVNGSWFFYATGGRYDVNFSGAGITSPFTFGDHLLFDPSGLRIDITDLPYGATANDSSNDDLAAIQAAINAASAAGGGTVFIPTGVFDVVPAGNATTCITMKPGVSLAGAGPQSIIRVKAATGNFEVLFCDVSPMNTTGFVMRDLTIDHNIANVAGVVSDVAGFRQIMVRFFFSSNVVINRLHVKYSGTNGISVNSASALKNAYVLNTEMAYTRQAGGSYDNTALYLEGQNLFAYGNVVTGAIVAAPATVINGSAVSGIECHGGPCTIVGNIIESTRFCMNLVSAFGADPEQNLVSVVGNICRSTNFGIDMRSLDAHTFNGIEVSSNIVEVRQVAHALTESTGIVLRYLVAAIGGSFSNVVIANNVVSFQDEGAGRALTGNDFINYAIGVAPKGSVSNAIVSGNTIINAPVQGIRVGNASELNVTNNVRIDGNTILDFGQNKLASNFFRRGIEAESTITSLSITGNVFRDTKTTTTGNFAVQLAGGGTYSLVTIKNNIGAEYASLGSPIPAGVSAEIGNTPRYSAAFTGTDNTPANGDYEGGDVVLNTGAISPGVSYGAYLVASRGTVGTLGVITGTTSIGSDIVGVSVATGLKVNQFVTIAGTGGVRAKILRIVGLTLAVDVTYSVAAAGALTYASPILRPIGLSIISDGSMYNIGPLVDASPPSFAGSGTRLAVTGTEGQGNPAYTGGSLLVLRGNSAAATFAGQSIIAGTTGRAFINFGDSTSGSRGRLAWSNNTGAFYIGGGRVGIGMTDESVLPNSGVQLASSLAVPVRFVALSASVLDTDFIMEANAATGAISLTLPTAVGKIGRLYSFVKVDSSVNAVTVVPSGAELVCGNVSLALSFLSDALSIASNGVNWICLSRSQPNFKPRFTGTASTGVGSALLGTNSPATILAAPYQWLQAVTPDGTTVFVPAWK